MGDPDPTEGADPHIEDRRAKPREGSERRRKERVALSEELKTAARLRARGICECSNQNCWHFRRCKAPGVAYMPKRSTSGALMCDLFCRECARTWGGRADRL